MSSSTHRLSDRALLALPALAGVATFVVLSVLHGLVGAFIGASALFWGLVASTSGAWLFRRGGWLLAAVAVLTSFVLWFASFLFLVRALDL